MALTCWWCERVTPRAAGNFIGDKEVCNLCYNKWVSLARHRSPTYASMMEVQLVKMDKALEEGLSEAHKLHVANLESEVARLKRLIEDIEEENKLLDLLAADVRQELMAARERIRASEAEDA